MYRLDHQTSYMRLMGKVVERRRGERNNNVADMLRLAQKLYPTSPRDNSEILVVDERSHGGPSFGSE